MICSVCGTQEASIHLTEIINDQMIEVHLCENCAQEKGTDFKTHFNFGELLSGLNDLGLAAKLDEKRPAGRCPQCGLTYDEFGKTGRLGCEACYTSFSKMLVPLIKRIQRSVQHIGKRPAGVAPLAVKNYDLRQLRERLRKAVQSEEFEEAARLRDEIKQLSEARSAEKSKKPAKKKNEEA